MKNHTYEYIQKRTKRVVVVHDVPITGRIDDGVTFSIQTAKVLDKIIDGALSLKLPRVELWFASKSKAA